MKLKVGDKVYIKPTNQTGVIIRIVDNPYVPDWMSADWYHVRTEGQESNDHYASCRKRHLKLLK